MASDHDFLMLTATGPAGRAHGAIPSALLTAECVRALVGTGRPAVGAVLSPGDVLASLNDFTPRSREGREEYGVLLKLALIAEAYGLVLVCGTDDPTHWAPDQDVLYDHDDVQAALGIVAGHLGCGVDQAAHRLWAHVDAGGTSLLETCADVISGRLTFVGTPDASTTSTATRRPAPRDPGRGA